VRLFAIKIALACKLRSFKDNLAGISLDQSQSVLIRKYAAEAVIQIGDEDTIEKLKPLAFGEAGEDPIDELKGIGLRALWPHHMTIEEVLSILTPPKDEQFIGEYEYFVRYYLPQNLTARDVIIAMKWFLNHYKADIPPFRELKILSDAIIVKSFAFISEPGELPTLVQVLLSRLQHSFDIGSFEIVGFEEESNFRQAIEDDHIRHTILDAILPSVLNFEIKGARLSRFSQTPLILSKDVPWMFEYLRKMNSDSREEKLALLICLKVDVNDSGHMELIRTASQEDDASAKVFRTFLSMREKQQKINSEKQRREMPTTPTLSLEVDRLLNRCESGESISWIDLTEELVKPNDVNQEESRFVLDITTLRGWSILDEQTRARVASAAEKFLLDQNPDSGPSLGITFSLRELAGMKAFVLLLSLGRVTEVTVDTWRRWAPVIIAHPIFSDDTSTTMTVHQDLVSQAYRFSPNETIESLNILIDNENKQKYPHFSMLEKFEKCWDTRLSEALMSKARDRNLSPNGVAYLLGILIDRDVDGARQLAKSLILPPKKRFSPHSSRRLTAVYLAGVLLLRVNDPLYLATWSVIKKYPQFGRAIFAVLAKKYELDSFGIDQLTEEQLADLYTWLVQQYPYEKDPDNRGAHYVTPRESIVQFRNSVLRHLSQRGTQLAVDAIQNMSSNSPNDVRLKMTLQESKNSEAYHAWSLLDPKAVIDLATNKEKRLVKNGHDLLDVLIESLTRLQKDLHSETPAVYFLWNHIEDVFRPKTETELSDWIKLHLERDLKQREIIALREVEIRRTGPKSKGQQTDIYVRARRKNCNNKNDSITAIVEVKGSWNRKLRKGIEEQLVDRYLKNYECSYGLYVICSVYCEQWDADDPRKKQSPKNAERLQKKYDSIAEDLSQPGTLVKVFVIDAALPKDATA
jgi:hypothetical protein